MIFNEIPNINEDLSVAVKKIELISLSVTDLAQAKKFFTQTVGLNLVKDCPEFGWLELCGTDGGTTLGIGKKNEQCGNMDQKNAVISLTVDDIVATKADFEAKGVKFNGDIMEVPGHVKLAFFADSEGNEFFLAENLDGK